MIAIRVARARQVATVAAVSTTPGPQEQLPRNLEDQHQHAQEVLESPPLERAQLKCLGDAVGGTTPPGIPHGAFGELPS
eukprot:13071659-Alexandrium_andersonii.AAC.1